MRRVALPAMLIAAAAGACCGRAPAEPMWPAPLSAGEGLPARMESALAANLPGMMTQAAIPGLALSLLAGGTVWSRGFGVADASTGKAVDDQTVFEAGSLGQPVLAVIALRLVQDGVLDLDRPIARDFSDPEVGRDPLYGRVTLRHLLSHTSGLGNLTHGAARVIHFLPGDHFSYSGLGYLVAQRLIEHVTKQPFDAAAARIVFGPAAMTQSSFVWQPRFEDHFATGHDTDGRPMQKRRPSIAFAPASFHTTAADYGRFLAALFDGHLLDAVGVRAMETEQIAVTPACVECLPAASGPRSDRIFWGLGWGIDRSASGQVLWQWGDNDIFRGYAAVWPERRVGFMFMTNGANGLAVRDALVRHVMGTELPDWAFVKYDQFDAPETVAMASIQAAFARGPELGTAEYRRQKAHGMTADEQKLALMGFKFFSDRQPTTAIAIWELEVEEFPRAWRAFDSLGLAYQTIGDRARSVASYQRALAINPADAVALKALGNGR